MVRVKMRDQDRVNPLDCLRGDLSDVAADMQDAVPQDRIGEDARAAYLGEDGGMTDKGQLLLGCAHRITSVALTGPR